MGPDYGIVMNPSKTKCLLNGFPSLEDAQRGRVVLAAALGLNEDEAARSLLIPEDSYRLGERYGIAAYGLVVLGIPIGSPRIVTEWFHDYFEKLILRVEQMLALRDMLQVQWLLMFYCVNARMNHFMRVIPTDILLPHLVRFNVIKKRVLVYILGVPDITERQWFHSQLPMRRGGLGLTDMTVVASSSYRASQIEVESYVIDTCRDGLGVASTAWGSKVAAGKLGLSLPPNPRGIQGLLVRALQNTLADAFFAEAQAVGAVETPSDCARYLSLDAPGAAGWLESVPIGSLFYLQSLEFRVLMQLRVGTVITFLVGINRCDHCIGEPEIGPRAQHLNNCQLGGQATIRHDKVKLLVKELADRAGVHTEVEPVGAFPLLQPLGASPILDACVGSSDDPESTNKRVDLHCHDAEHHVSGKDALLDITVTNPEGKGNLLKSKSATVRGGSLASATKYKTEYYRSLVDANGYRFLVLGMETHGRLGEDFWEFLKSYCRLIAARSGKAYAAVKRFWVRRFSFALQKGNANIVIGKITALRHRARSRAADMRSRIEAAWPEEPDAEDEDEEEISTQDISVYQPTIRIGPVFLRRW
jgi:hypothetical protein